MFQTWLIPIFTARACGKVMFTYCLCVCTGYNFWLPWHRNFPFWYGGTSWPYLGQVWGTKVIVTFVKLILTVGPQILLLQSINMIKGQGHLKVKVILRSFENQIVSVWISIPKRVVGFRPNACLSCLWCNLFTVWLRNTFWSFYSTLR